MGSGDGREYVPACALPVPLHCVLASVSVCGVAFERREAVRMGGCWVGVGHGRGRVSRPLCALAFRFSLFGFRFSVLDAHSPRASLFGPASILGLAPRLSLLGLASQPSLLGLAS